MPELAKIHSLDIPHAIGVEFPAKVQNDSKAVSMVGGPEAIVKASQNRDELLELRFRPDDPFEHPISSRLVHHQNVLLKIDIDRAYLTLAHGNVQKALQISKGQYTVEPCRIVASNLRFREMSDYQYVTENSPFVKKMESTIMHGKLDQIKSLELEGVLKSSSLKEQLDIIPPPKFSQQLFPFPYGYRQNPMVSIVDDGSGEKKLVNLGIVPRLPSIIISWSETETPTGPRRKLDPPKGAVKKCVEVVKALFDKRPSWTRKAINLHLDEEGQKALRYALPYVAYAYKSGPYRSAYFKYGVNPRMSREYAIYQVEHFRIYTVEEEQQRKKKEREDKANGNLMRDDVDIELRYQFTGNNLPDVRMMQFCDITDPTLHDLIYNSEYRDEASMDDGWYKSGDINAIRRALRTKLVAIKKGDQVDEDLINRIINDRSSLPPPEEEDQEEDQEEEEEEEEEEEGDDEEGDKDEDMTSTDKPLKEKEKELLQWIGQGSDELKGLFGYVQQKDADDDEGHVEDNDAYGLMEEDSSDED